MVDLRTNQAAQEIIVVTTGAKAEFFLASEVQTLRAHGSAYSDKFVLKGLNGRVDHIDLASAGSGDLIELTADPDSFASSFSSLIVDGGAGDDYIRVDPTLLGDGTQAPSGYANAYTVRGDAGVDRIKLLRSIDDDPGTSGLSFLYAGVVLDGGADDDVIIGNNGGETVVGGDGDDVILTYGGDDVVYGDDIAGVATGDGADFIATGDGADTVYAGGGDDKVFAGFGEDTVHGGGDADTLMGEGDIDHLYGDAGDDLLVGGLGDDVLAGGANDDTATWEVGDGADSFDGGTGTDQVSMAGYVLDQQAFYDDPDNYVVDDDLVDVIDVKADTAFDSGGTLKSVLIDWTHGATAVQYQLGAVETLKLDGGRGADELLVRALDTTAVDNVRLAAGQDRTIVPSYEVARDPDGGAIGQDVTIGGIAGDQFKLQLGAYGAASTPITLVDDGSWPDRLCGHGAGHAKRVAQAAAQQHGHRRRRREQERLPVRPQAG